MWTLFWGVLTMVLFVLAMTLTAGHFNALLMVLAIMTAGVFGFSFSVTLGRLRHEGDRKHSQPLGHVRSPDASADSGSRG